MSTQADGRVGVSETAGGEPGALELLWSVKRVEGGEDTDTVIRVGRDATVAFAPGELRSVIQTFVNQVREGGGEHVRHVAALQSHHPAGPRLIFSYGPHGPLEPPEVTVSLKETTARIVRDDFLCWAEAATAVLYQVKDDFFGEPRRRLR